MSRYILNERQFKTKLRACIINEIGIQYRWILIDEFFPSGHATCSSFPEIFGLRDHYVKFLKENSILENPQHESIAAKHFKKSREKLYKQKHNSETFSCSLFRLMVLNEFAIQNNIKLPKNL